MSSVGNGLYRLYNAATGLLLDVAGNGFAQGTNVQIWTSMFDQNDAQIFEISTRSNNSRRVTHRISGKNLEVVNGLPTVGANVQIWRERSATWAGQCLAFEDTGNTMTIGGTSYPTFYISLLDSSDYTFDVSGSSAGSNVLLKRKTSPTMSRSNEWAVVPIPKFESGGLYEIRSYLDPKNLALDIYAANPANGTNLQIYGVNHNNNQKFFITEEETGKYSIRCLHSGKYIDVSQGIAADGTNVQAWQDNDLRPQRWKMMNYGTTTIDGKSCQIVRFGSYVTSDGMTYMMDVSGAQTRWETNVQIWSYIATSPAQIFVLYPTDAADPTMPVPYDFGITDNITGTRLPYSETTTFKLGWKCAKSWAGDGTNHYEYRFRRRTMSSQTSSWRAWNDWSVWKEAPATTDGSYVFMPESFNSYYEFSNAKDSQWEFQLRAAGASENYKMLHGTHIDSIFDVYLKPSVSLTSAGWSPDGLVLGMSSNYRFGTTYANIKRITLSNGKKLFDKTATLEATGTTGSGTVSNDDMIAFPEDGATIRVMFTPGYDQHPSFADVQTATLTVNYDSGTRDVTPTFVRNGYKLTALVPKLGEEHVWVPFKNALYECEKDAEYPVPAGYTAFNVLYPMGEDFQVFTEAHNASKSQWGTDASEYSAISLKAHAFDWDGKTLYIDQFASGSETYGASGKANYQADVLDSRKYESVSFAKTMSKEIEVSGVLTDYTVEDVEAMVGNHVTYRSPDGGIYEAAVTSYSATVHSTYTEISVSMIVETR